MGNLEHELTAVNGKPTTMLRHTEKGVKYPLFLYKNPNYPHLKCIDDVEGRPPEPLNDCNGFCGLNDLSARNPTEDEINYQES
jgi:hypothetical protein